MRGALSAPLPQLALAYALPAAALRADFIWLRDSLDVFWRAATAILTAGLLQDLAVVLAIRATLALVPRSQLLRLALFGLLALLTTLTVVNLAVLSGMSIPADLSMLGYLSDPFTTQYLEPPVPIGPNLLRLGLALLVLGAGLGWARNKLRSPVLVSPALGPTWPVALGALVLGGTAWLGGTTIAGLDHRARQVSHADGASWLFLQMAHSGFTPPRQIDARIALLPEGTNQDEVFVDPNYPLARAPLSIACQLGKGGARCDADSDQDGTMASSDCDDHDPRQRPGLEDVPGDGRDQDCSGLDAEPPNLVVLQLEGLPARLLPATGGDQPGLAPELEALVRRPDAVLFTRFESASIITAGGFASELCSVLPFYGTPITRLRPLPHLRCLPAILTERGYVARFVQNGSPEFDRQGEFAKAAGFVTVEGADDIARAVGDDRRVSHWGLLDEILFRRLVQLVREQRPTDPPLFLWAQTINNHYPYTVPPSYRPYPATGGIWDKLRNTGAFVDQALGTYVRAIDALVAESGRRPLLVVLSGDHGHPSDQHPSNATPAAGLFEENVHTPLVFWYPGHPERLERLRRAGVDLPASALDVLPTVLDSLGIRAAHASMGRSMLRQRPRPEPRALSLNPLAGGLVRMRRVRGTVVARAWPPRIWAFAADDLHELGDLADPQPPWARQLSEEAVTAVMSARALLQQDRVWSADLIRLEPAQVARH